MRNDTGQLWEQYIIGERMKYNSSKAHHLNYHFWRTYDGQEIDLIEIDSRRQLLAFECKWQSKSPRIPVAFAKAYPDARYETVHRENYLRWVVGAGG